jgi:hypothetical protein
MYKLGDKKMTTLTKKEIVAQLKRLGIYSFNELESCLREYKEYCSECYGHLSSG